MDSRIKTPEERLARSRQLGIIVDEQDEWLLSTFTWRLVGGYVVTRHPLVGRVQYLYLHHMIAGMPIDRSLRVDHRDRNKLNNRRGNFRYTTQSVNLINSDRGDDPMLGIRRYKNGLYYVRLRRHPGYIYLRDGWMTIEEAQQARDGLRRELGELE